MGVGGKKETERGREGEREREREGERESWRQVQARDGDMGDQSMPFFPRSHSL